MNELMPKDSSLASREELERKIDMIRSLISSIEKDIEKLENKAYQYLEEQNEFHSFMFYINLRKTEKELTSLYEQLTDEKMRLAYYNEYLTKQENEINAILMVEKAQSYLIQKRINQIERNLMLASSPEMFLLHLALCGGFFIGANLVLPIHTLCLIISSIGLPLFLSYTDIIGPELKRVKQRNQLDILKEQLCDTKQEEVQSKKLEDSASFDNKKEENIKLEDYFNRMTIPDLRRLKTKLQEDQIEKSKEFIDKKYVKR